MIDDIVTKQEIYGASLNKMLQRDIEFVIEDSDGDFKNYRQGKLLLININDFYVYFTLQVANSKNGKPRTYELPFPFDYEIVSDEHVIFDYTKDKFIDGNQEIAQQLQDLEEPVHKMWNKWVHVRVKND